MKKFLSLCSLLLVLSILQGCAIYGAATDERLTGTMRADNVIITGVKNRIAHEKLSTTWKISVFCYYGHVFLVGECPENLRSRAVELAKQDKRVLSVTPHWFSSRVGDSDIVLATKVRTELIGTSNLNSTRIDSEVNANRVVLLGVASSAAERKLAVKAARSVSGVNSVTSYIMLPLKPGVNYRPTGNTYPGLHPKGSAARSSSPKKSSPKKSAPAQDVDYGDTNVDYGDTGADYGDPNVDYGDQDVPDLSPESGTGTDEYGRLQGTDI